MTSIFTVAHRGTFDQFNELFSDGDEKRVRWGKSLFIEALSNTDPGFDIELTGLHDTMYDVARRWPHRQALADRIARYLEARSERHTEEHA